MVDITVQRGAADRPGPDIQEPLLANEGAALARGRAELNAGTEHDTIRVVCKYQPALAVGDLVRISDSWQGTAYVALVTGITHTAGGGTVLTELDLWRPRT